MVLPNGQFRVVFTANDYQASLAFYRDDLGLQIDHDWDYGPGDRGTVFKAGTGLIEIFGRAPGLEVHRPQGMGLLIQVEDADQWLKRARERRLTVVQEPVTYSWGHRILRLQDPDGIIVSLFSLVAA